MKIAIDFDGTIVTHAYPEIGQEVPRAIDYMKMFKEGGVHLILWTMRSGKELQEAIDFCAERDVVFDSVNEGIGDTLWTTSNKAYANIYIDDAAFGCPLTDFIMDENFVIHRLDRKFVNWYVVGKEIMKRIQDEKDRI